MDINSQSVDSSGYKLTLVEDGIQYGSVYIFIMKTDSHEEPYATMEDLFVNEEYRNRGIGTRLIEMAIEKARDLGCYKLLGQSRYSNERAHQLYLRMGFRDHGKNFRMDLIK